MKTLCARCLKEGKGAFIADPHRADVGADGARDGGMRAQGCIISSNISRSSSSSEPSR